MRIVHLITFGLLLHTAQNKLCTKEDLHFHTSDCDELGSQWVYKVPDLEIQCTLTNESIPKRAKTCDKFCPSGQYLDMENQECKNCSSGYFSKGNALEITKWPEIPPELYVDVSYNNRIINSCNESSWYAKNDYLLGKAKSDCTTLLSMKLHNLHDGLVSFTYNIEEYGTMAFFTVRNERCSQLPGSSYMLAYTGYNVFYKMTVKLPKGHHILQWYLFADPNSLQALWGPSESTMKIGQITVTGTPPILRCTPCPAGTWGATEGQAVCDICPENTFSNTGAQKCEVCSAVEYSRPGSTHCTARLPCTNVDYVPVWSPCDSNGTMQKSYKWIEPIICNTQLGVALPQAEKPVACRPCAVGTEPLNHTHCADCQVDKPSLSATCLRCGADRVPIYGILYDTWSRFPPHLKTWCTTLGTNKCQPWLLYANFISSGLGTSSQTAATLELSLPFGFVRSTEDNDDKGDLIVRDPPIPDTHLRVEFEMICSALCQLVLKQSHDGQRDVEVMSWYAGQKRQNYTYWIKSSQPVKFYWIFEKNVAKDTKDLAFLHDHIRIYQIEVANAKKLSVIGCRTCLKGVKNGRCVTCPPGLFYESRMNTTTHQEVINCTACPTNTVVVSDAHAARSVPEACIPCEPGTKAVNHSVCVIDTMPATTDGMLYNLTNLLSGNRTIQGTKLFTSSGLPYRYEYHLTLKYGDHVHCLNTLSNGVSYGIESLICRHTTVWESTTSETEFYTQPLSLADRLVKAIPSNYSKEFWSEVNTNLTRAGWTKDDIGTDLHYIFNTYASSINCPHGRWSVVTFRCGLAQDMWFANFLYNESKDMGTLELPPACPAGTCDGCVYQFLWTSILACPICSPAQFQRFYGECKYGTRYVYLTAPQVCRIPRGMQTREVQQCPLLTAGQYVALFLALSTFLTLGFIIFICHRRNKKLEYKYMKLIQSQEGRGQPTSCALDEHEEDSVDSFGRRSIRQISNTNAHLQLEPTSVAPVKATNPVIPMPKLQLPILGPILFKKNDDQDRQPLPENEVIG